MPDYVLADAVALKNNLTPDDLKRFERESVLHPVRKNGRTYYSAHDVLELKAVLHLVRTRGMSLQQAATQIASRGALHVVGSGD